MARFAAAGLLLALGAATAVAVVGGASADPPVTGGALTIYRTITERTDRRIEHHGVEWWRAHAVHNRRALNHAAKRLRANRRQISALRVSIRRRWAPTVRYGLALATAAFGVEQTRRAYCESRLDPFAAEGHGPVGLLQFQPSTWAGTPFGRFSIFDPVAQALAGGWMVAHGRSGEWSCGL